MIRDVNGMRHGRAKTLAESQLAEYISHAWLRKSPTCRRHVAPTAKCRHFWPKCPCRADTILIPTHFFLSGFADIHQCTKVRT